MSLPGGPPALALTQQPACFQCCPHVSRRCLPSSLKQCCPLPRALAVQPARAWLCHPHAPPISMQLRQCSPHVPRTMPHMRPAVPRRQTFLSSFGTAPRKCSDGVSHASDVASPTSVTVHSIASIVEPGLGGGPTLALLRTLSQAEFTSPSPSRRLMED